jgi:hypothetical protein
MLLIARRAESILERIDRRSLNSAEHIADFHAPVDATEQVFDGRKAHRLSRNTTDRKAPPAGAMVEGHVHDRQVVLLTRKLDVLSQRCCRLDWQVNGRYDLARELVKTVPAE